MHDDPFTCTFQAICFKIYKILIYIKVINNLFYKDVIVEHR